MDFFKMYLRTIESDKQSFNAFIKRRGFVENLGQAEHNNFKDKVNNNEGLTQAERADLCGRYIEMMDGLEL
jgi:hypothetical protein